MTILIIFLFTISILILYNYVTKIKSKNFCKNLKTYLVAFLVLLMVITLIVYPQNAVNAAFNGLLTWSTIVLPSLIPFFIGSEILIGLGVVKFIGVLLQPIMRPLFGVSGEGAFPFAMSMTSGYPVGITLVSKLRSQKSISKIEAQRLASFCSTSGPLFIIGAVSVGMLKNASLGPILAMSHYLGAITVGLVFKTYGRKNCCTIESAQKNYVKSAFNELIIARKKDGRSFSIIMSDAIKTSFNSMIMIGGFIVLYSVIIEILNITQIMHIISDFIISIAPFDLNPMIINGLLSGMIEMTNGCKIIASVQSTSALVKICSISFLIAWSGFSIHSQSISMLNNTDISTKIYILSKSLHGIFSCLYSYLLYIFMFKEDIVPSFSISTNSYQIDLLGNWIKNFNFSLKLEIAIIAVLLLTGLCIGLFSSIKTKQN